MQVGQKLVQKDLAKTLRTISEKGADGFYKGWVADAIVTSSQANKGIITQADLDKYKTRELAPVECDYRGYHVVSAPPPSSGGVVICEIMNILEGYPMKDLASIRPRACITRSKRCVTPMSIATAIWVTRIL